MTFPLNVLREGNERKKKMNKIKILPTSDKVCTSFNLNF